MNWACSVEQGHDNDMGMELARISTWWMLCTVDAVWPIPLLQTDLCTPSKHNTTPLSLLPRLF